MHLLQRISIALLLLNLVACSQSEKHTFSSSTTGGSESAHDTPPLPPCAGERVFTLQELASLNLRHSDYQLEGEGGMAICDDRSGYMRLGVRQHLQFSEVKLLRDGVDDQDRFVVRVYSSVPDKAALVRIAGELGIPADRLSVHSFCRIDCPEVPFFARFGNGSLIPAEGFIPYPGQNQFGFVLKIFNSSEAKLQEYLAAIRQGELELLWQPVGGVLSGQRLGKGQTWQAFDGVEILYSQMQEAGLLLRARVQRAIRQMMAWSLDPSRVHAKIPELYALGDLDWKIEPSITASNADDLENELAYLMKVNPQHPRASVWKAIVLLGNWFINDTEDKLHAALDYVNLQAWTPEHFQQLGLLAFQLIIQDGNHPFRGHAWTMALAIERAAEFNSDRMFELAIIARKLAERSLLTEGDPAVALPRVLAKRKAGLNGSNLNLYFEAYDAFDKQLYAAPANAEAACDRLVLSGKLTEENLDSFVSDVRRFEDRDGMTFNEAVAAAEAKLGLGRVASR